MALCPIKKHVLKPEFCGGFPANKKNPHRWRIFVFMHTRKHDKYGKGRQSLTHYVMNKYCASSLDEEEI